MEAAGRITRMALTAYGAHALFKSSPLERFYRDAASSAIMPPRVDFRKDMVGMLELGVDPREALSALKIAE